MPGLPIVSLRSQACLRTCGQSPVFFDKNEPKSLIGCFKFPAILLDCFGLLFLSIYAVIFKLSWSYQFEKKIEKNGKSRKSAEKSRKSSEIKDVF